MARQLSVYQSAYALDDLSTPGGDALAAILSRSLRARVRIWEISQVKAAGAARLYPRLTGLEPAITRHPPNWAVFAWAVIKAAVRP